MKTEFNRHISVFHKCTGFVHPISEKVWNQVPCDLALSLPLPPPSPAHASRHVHTHTHTHTHTAAAPMYTPNNEEFMTQEEQAALERFDPRKAPGEDTLSSEILLQVFWSFPTVFTEIDNECLKKGHFPKQWKRSVILPTVKPGKEELNEMGKFRPISLINIGGKILEKLLIDRINHHLY
jgi:hypothetical protein